MAKGTQIRFLRGTAAEVLAETPSAGEPMWRTDDKELVVGDGSTAGGIPVGSSGLSAAQALAFAIIAAN